MIKKERVERGQIKEEYVRLSITGKVDDILHKKVPVKLDKIFRLDTRKRKVILIEGAPGSGKSTLSWDICQRWGIGKLFREYEVVVLVQIRDPETQKACEIVELLPAQDRSMAQSVAAQVVACRGRKVLFVIDGWDEGGSSLPETSAVRRLIQPELCQENLLFESSVIVTSRPIASGDLQPLASSRIEIVGFTPSELRQYFSECLEGDCGAVEKLLERIGEHPEVEESCYLPLNAAIIVHLFLSEGQTIPSTQYGIFSAVVLNCIFRHLKQRTEEGRQIRSLESICSLPEVVREPFEHLCKLAYHGVVKNKIVFSHDDFAAVGIPTSASLLGLLQAVESMVSAGKCVSFNFLHLSIQELLAAFSISRLPSSEQISVFQQLVIEPRFSAVFQFYAAITKLQNPGIQRVIARIIQNAKQDWNQRPLLVSLLKCLFEAQDPCLCQFVAEALEGKLNLEHSSLTPLDSLSVGYFLSCVCVTTSGEFRVNLNYCSIEDHECRFLTRGLCMCPAPNSTATGRLHVELTENEICESGAQYIADMLRNSNIVHRLSLSWWGSCITEHGLKYIAEALLTNCSLVELDLANCSLEITQESGPVLCQMLKRNQTLRYLNLSDNDGVTDTGAFFIAEGLEVNTSLRALWLSVWDSAKAVESISQALTVNTTLKALGLSWNDVPLGETDVDTLSLKCEQNHKRLKSISECLLTNCNLVELHLQDCIAVEITQESGQVLCQMLQRNKTLIDLNLNENRGVSDTGTFFIAEGLKLNTSLRALWLSRCGISAEGAKFISEALAANTSLQILGLSNNKLGDTGVDSLANALKQNDSLKELYLGNCEMTDRGLELLAVALTVNNSLETLDFCGKDSISEGGLSVFTEHLKRNTGLAKLWLPMQFKSMLVEEAVNEARRRSDLRLIEVKREFAEYFVSYAGLFPSSIYVGAVTT